jgi:hypothetical protein
MSGSRLIDLIRQQTPKHIGIELATVITPPPDLRIRIDNTEINLEKDDLIVCEHLLEHSRIYSTSTQLSSSSMTPDGYGPHTHNLTAIGAEEQEITVHSNLEAGDRVAVQALPGGQQYLVIDRVVMM